MSSSACNPAEDAEPVAPAIEPVLPEPPSFEEPPPEDQMAEICLYRRRSIILLRRYAKLAMETGRLPSVLGGLEFQARISSYPLHTFEDAVIFVFDMERCLGELNERSYEVIARIVLRDETAEQVARRFQCARCYIYQILEETLDRLSARFLRRGLLDRSRISPELCQDGKSGVFTSSS